MEITIKTFKAKTFSLRKKKESLDINELVQFNGFFFPFRSFCEVHYGLSNRQKTERRANN